MPDRQYLRRHRTRFRTVKVVAESLEDQGHGLAGWNGMDQGERKDAHDDLQALFLFAQTQCRPVEEGCVLMPLWSLAQHRAPRNLMFGVDASKVHFIAVWVPEEVGMRMQAISRSNLTAHVARDGA